MTYIYKDGDPKHPYERKGCLGCGQEALIKVTGKYCSLGCSQTKAHNSQWKDRDAGYMSKHQRLYRVRGKAESCVWGCSSSRYEWANLTGNYDNADDFAPMCKQCHARYDAAVAKCFDKLCKRGHSMTTDSVYSRIVDGKEVRQCKQCAKDRAARARKGGQ